MRISMAIAAIAVFFGAMVFSQNVGIPEATTATIEYFNSVPADESGQKLSSGFDSFRQSVLIGLEGLWNLGFAGFITGLAYVSKFLKFASEKIDAYLESRKDQTPADFADVGPQGQMLEQMLIDAAYEGDAEAIEFAANRLRSGGGMNPIKWVAVRANPESSVVPPKQKPVPELLQDEVKTNAAK